MGLEGKLEADVKVKSSADNLFKLLTEEVHNVPDASSDNVHGVEVHEGDWTTLGSVKLWSYTNVGGDILEQYCGYKIVYHVAPDGDSVRVNLQIFYEKFDENQDDPDNYLWFLINVLKDTGAHLVGKQG